MNSKIKKYQKVIYSIILLVTLLWVLGLFAAPLWADAAGIRGDVSSFLYTFYSKSCHQLEYRSFMIGGYKFGVCSRCSFIYFAFLLGVIVYPVFRKLNNIDLPPIWYLLAAAFLVAADAGLDIANILENTFISREVTGSIIGFVLPFYLIPGLIRIFYEFTLPPITHKSSSDNSNKHKEI